jgi:uncharacterized membrane protein
MRSGFLYSYLVLVLIGLADASYLSALHFYQADPGCSLITGCDAVLSSEYAVILGIPLAYGGFAYYLTLLFGGMVYYQYEIKKALQVLFTVNLLGFLFSLWLVYVQAFILEAFCQYCLVSALTTTLALVTLSVGLKKGSSSAE